MKTCILLVIATIASCTSKKGSENNITNKQRDFIEVNNRKIFLDSIPESLYISANLELSKNRVDDTSRVFQDSLKLRFQLSNGSELILENDTTEGFESYIDFNYLGTLSSIDYWLVKIVYYEGVGHLLVDKNTGEKIYTYGVPIFSKNNQHFICSSWDLEAGYDPNGMQLFEIEDGKIIEKWTVELDNWGPSQVRWKNDTLIYIEQTRLNPESSNDYYIKSYKSMSIK